MSGVWKYKMEKSIWKIGGKEKASNVSVMTHAHF